MTRRRQRRTRPGALIAWALVAAIVALGQAADRGDGPEHASLPATPPPPVDPEHAPVRVVAAPPPAASNAAAAPARPKAKRPFTGVRSFASPLIMPRLRLPRALSPRLSVVSSLKARAKPGEPVAVTLTAYCLRGRTRRGAPVRPGIIAADPRLFPMARHVELFAGGHYLGKFLVDDTGGHILGRRIDIWTPDCADARAFGRRTGVATLVAR